MINALNDPVQQNMAASTGVVNADASAKNEMIARQQGYPSYEAMIQFLRNREVQKQGGPAPAGQGGPPQAAPPQDNRGAFQRLLDGLAGRG